MVQSMSKSGCSLDNAARRFHTAWIARWLLEPTNFVPEATMPKNLRGTPGEIESQAREVARVKRFESGMVVNPITMTPDQTLATALELMARHRISGIPIVEGDLITDNGEQVYSALKLRGIQHLLVAGVHTNMCILNRSFAIKAMTNRGVRTILVRDLTDSMYNSRARPFVDHFTGNDLVTWHIEKYWCPWCSPTS